MPDEQREPQALFQPFDVAAQGRLGHEKTFRRPMQGIFLGHNGEVVKQVEIRNVERGVCHTEKVSRKK